MGAGPWRSGKRTGGRSWSSTGAFAGGCRVLPARSRPVASTGEQRRMARTTVRRVSPPAKWRSHRRPSLTLSKTDLRPTRLHGRSMGLRIQPTRPLSPVLYHGDQGIPAEADRQGCHSVNGSGRLPAGLACGGEKEGASLPLAADHTACQMQMHGADAVVASYRMKADFCWWMRSRGEKRQWTERAPVLSS